MNDFSLRQAVILAGGAGTRLKPFTLTNPKPLIPLNGSPFIDYLLKLLKGNGIEEVLVLIGYLGEKIKQHLGDGKRFGLHIYYSHLPLIDDQGTEIESGTRLKHAQNLLHDHFLLMYCDNYWPMDLGKMIQHYKQQKTLGMVTAYNNNYGLAEYGFSNNLLLDNSHLVLKYDPKREDPNLNATDIGFFIFNKKVVKYIPNGSTHIGRDLLPKLIKHKELSAFRTDHRYYFITNPDTLKTAEKFLKKKKVVFLDRDGVINKKIDKDYVRNWDQFKILPGVVEGLKILSQKNYHIFIVTNQRGIARGLMKESDLEAIHQNMLMEFKKNKIKVRQIYHCPHDKDMCDCRKPKPGLLLKASNEHHLNLTQSLFIGDEETDLQAGDAAGCKTILVSPEMNFLHIVKSIT